MRFLKRPLAILAAILLLTSTTLPAAAQSADSSPKGSGLSISPTLSQFTIKPGESQNLDIKLKNVTVSDINAQAFINDFLADGTTGNPKIISDPNKVSPNSIRKFVVGLQDVPLKIGEQKTANLTLQIPKNTAPGAYYGIVRYKAVPAGDNTPKEGEVALSASVGSIVLITVPGNLREQVQLNGVHVYNGNHEGTFFFKKPNKVGVEVRNLGNGFVAPFGTVEVQKTGFNKASYTYKLNDVTPRGVILPGAERIFINDLKNVDHIGRYKIIASVAYGSGSQVLTTEKTFWYIPGWIFILVLVLLALLIVAVLVAYRRHHWFSKRSHKNRK